MKKLLLLLLLPILSFSQNCVPTLIVKDTCSYGYAKTFVEWESLDSSCVISTSHQGTPYNTGSYSWNNQLDTNHIFYNNYSPGDPFASSEGFWFLLEMQDGSFTDTVFASEFTCISGCMDASYDNYNPVANVPANCLAMPPPQDYCPDSTKTSITIELTPDTYAGETSLDIINQNGDTLLNLPQGFFSSIGTGNLYTNTLCVPISDTIKFYIYDSYGDGICGSCFGGVDGNVLVTDECGDIIYSLLPGDNLNFGDIDSSAAFVTKDCSWEPTYGCPDPAYLEFNPNADYLDVLLCNTLRVPGCMDTTMFDFDPVANVPLMEDSCSYTLNLIDGGGDGWLGAYVVVSQLGNTFGPYTNTNSYIESVSLNLKSNYKVTIRAYSQTSSDATLTQVGFELINPEGVIIESGGTNPWNDKIKLFPKKYITVPNCPTICDPYTYGCVDILAYNYSATVNTDDNSCYYNPGCTDPQFLEYYTQGYVSDFNNGSCLTTAVWGCTDILAFNYDSLTNIDNGGCIPVILGCMQPLAFNYNAQANTADTCIAIVYGCMSSIAINYNSLANTDDGSCIGIIYGCTDTSMWNYSPSANVDDGQCIPYAYGCTDVTMWNYNQQANTDNGSCLEYVYGCTNSVMFNYNPLANTDNENCIPYIYGCTNPIAINYNVQANTDDFSCIIPVYGCMDSIAFNYDPLANTDNGTCVPVVLGCTNPTALNYDAFANVDDFSCVLPIYGCLDSLAFNYDALANVDNGSCLPVILGCIDPIALNYCDSCNTDDFSCVLPIYGCTDSIMFNYNPLANVDNSSCIPYVFGCTDPSMLNYDPLSNTEDFTCIEFIYGCMEEEALNYDSLANTENNSCITIVEGCMDLNAYNYSDEANVSDGSCNYDAGCITGPGLPYWLNDPCYAWVISVDDYCCNNAWDQVCQLTYNYCDGTYIGDIPARKAAIKKIVAITDLLGRPVKEGNNKLLFYIYDDGTVEKKINKNN